MKIEENFPTEFDNTVSRKDKFLGYDENRRRMIYNLIQRNWRYETGLIFKINKKHFMEPIVRTGPIAGFGPLHLACIQGKIYAAEQMINDFHLDVNAVAEDGIQPIQLACLLGYADIVKILGKAGANINAEISHDMFSKYVKDKVWCSDFGNKMTLITYAITVLHDNEDLIRVLIDLEPNLKIKSSRNKTLLMYLLQNARFISAKKLVLNEEYQEFMNIRDDDGFHAIHYILHQKNYGNYRYIGTMLGKRDDHAGDLIYKLQCVDCDFQVMINDDPDTLLLNMAAYRSSPAILQSLLPYCPSIKYSKALFNSTLPPGDSDKYFLPTQESSEQEQLSILDDQRIESKELILQDLTNRHAFGLSVPAKEKILMDKLVLTDAGAKNIVDSHKKNFIEGVLKNIVIQYEDKSMTLFDFILISIDEVKLRIFVRNKKFLNAFLESSKDMPDEYEYEFTYFRNLLRWRINKAYERVKLLEELKNIPHLRKFMPVPYEWVLDIVDNLSNKDLEKFIGAFYLKFDITYDHIQFPQS